MPLPEYDEIHVVSDLHMGGEPGFQILREAGRLAAFIRWVGEQRPQERVALVLNGDIIDTLAEPSEKGVYIVVDRAEATVQRIMADPAFAPVWAALADFVAREGRTLVMVLGNHDLELSFPAVQRVLVERLTNGNGAARSRIEFSTMGAGYSCLVGGARVFCTHGNEVDPWNYVRYEDLARAGRRLNCGRSLKPSEWEPNAGTKMVKDIMNEVKGSYPWIDLLKPEMEAAVGVLLALDSSQLDKVGRLLPIIGKKVVSQVEVDQRLSADGFVGPEVASAQPASIDSLLGPNLLAGIRSGGAGGGAMADELLLAAEKSYKTGTAVTDADDTTLGYGQLMLDRLTGWFTGISPAEALRRALQDWLKDDRTFEVGNRDEPCAEVVDSVGSGIHFLVSGHTHLERAIDLGQGRFYFNCGTWIRLLRITEAMLQDEKSFEPLFKLLDGGDMAAIDRARFGGEPFVLDQCGAVSISREGSQVRGRLVHIDAEGRPQAPAIQEFAR